MRAKLIFSLILLLLCSPLYAQFNQWEPENGVPLRLSPSIQYFGSMENNSDGQTLLAWSEYQNNSHKILVMLTDAEGQFLWNNPLIVCNVEENQQFPDILPLDNGQWLIAWMDFRDDILNQYRAKVYVQKINATANLLFDPDGLVISDEVRHPDYAPQLVADENGGAIVSWTSHNDNTDYDLYAQRIDSNGSNLWAENGIIIAGGEGNQGGNYRILPDENNGAYLAWVDFYLSTSGNGNGVTVQRIDGDGNPLWTETNNGGLLISNIAYNIYKVSIASDGTGGLFVTWDENVDPNWQGNIYAQHLDSDGNNYWSENGENISQMETGLCRRPYICTTAENEAIIAFDYELEVGDHASLYMQKISGVDEISLDWNEGQSVLLAENEEPYLGIHYPRLVADGSGGAFAVWNANTYNDFLASLVQLQKISSTGELEWTEPLDLCGDNTGFSPRIKATDENRVIVSWDGRLAEGSSVQLQAVDNLGQITYDEGGVAITSGIDGLAYNLTSTKSGQNIYAGWLDHHSHNGHFVSMPYIQKLDHDGNIYFTENGLNLAPGLYDLYDNFNNDCDSLRLCPDNDGGIYAAWNMYDDTGTKNIFMQHINIDGTLLWGDTGFIIEAHDYHDKSILDLIPLDDGDFLAVYASLTDDWYLGLTVERFTADHISVWNEAINLPSPYVDDEYYIDCIQLNDSEFAVSYTCINNSNGSKLFLAKFDLDGNLSWEEPIEFESQFLYHGTLNSKLNFLNNNILLTWIDRNTQTDDNFIRTTLISPDGDYIWDDEIKDIIDLDFGMRTVKVNTANDESYSFWVSYVNLNGPAEYRVFIQRYNYAGEPLLNPAQGILVDTDYDINDMETIVLDDNSLYLVLEKYEDSGENDLLFKHFDTDGNIVNSGTTYPDNGATLTAAKHGQHDPEIIQSGDSGFISIWEDYRTTSIDRYTNIYMQKVDDGFTGITGQNLVLQPDKFEISNAWPNPFNPSININYQLGFAADVKISVYDILGREVAVLLNQYMQAGNHFINWNGLSSNGNLAASGTYFIQMEAADFKQVKKITLLK